jgi:hypothetical protein
LTVFFGSWTDGCSSSTTSLKKPLIRPSTMRGSTCSGLPSSRAVASAMRRSFSSTSPGTSSRVVYCGRAAAMCMATLLAASSLPPSYATSAPIAGGRSEARQCRYSATGPLIWCVAGQLPVVVLVSGRTPSGSEHSTYWFPFAT